MEEPLQLAVNRPGLSYVEYVELLSNVLHDLDKQQKLNERQITILVDDITHVWLASPRSIAKGTIKSANMARLHLEKCNRCHLKRLRTLSKKYHIQYIAMDICKYI